MQKQKTSTNADTEAEILALIGKRVLLDLTSGVYTVDTTTVDNAANGILIVGGNANEASIVFRSAIFWNNFELTL